MRGGWVSSNLLWDVCGDGAAAAGCIQDSSTKKSFRHMKLLEILRQSVPFVSKVFNEVQKSFSGSNYELQNWFYPGLFKMSSKGWGLDLMQECPNCGPGAICGLQMIFFLVTVHKSRTVMNLTNIIENNWWLKKCGNVLFSFNKATVQNPSYILHDMQNIFCIFLNLWIL